MGPQRVEAKPRKSGAHEGWGQKGGAQKGGGPRRVEPQKGGAQKGGAQKGGAQKGGARRVGAQNFALFFPTSRHNFISSFSLLGSFRGILVVFEALGP